MKAFTVAWSHPEGQGFATVHAESPVDACRQLRYLLPNYAAQLRILYVIEEPVAA